MTECKEVNKKKLIRKLQQNDMREMWSVMTKITGDQTDGSLDRTNELHMYYKEVQF